MKYITVKPFRLSFKYDKDKKGRLIGTKVSVDTGTEVLSAQSKCHKGDTFDKETGRKVALKKAFSTAIAVTREERKEFWKNYNDSKPGGRW